MVPTPGEFWFLVWPCSHGNLEIVFAKEPRTDRSVLTGVHGSCPEREWAFWDPLELSVSPAETSLSLSPPVNRQCVVEMLSGT